MKDILKIVFVGMIVIILSAFLIKLMPYSIAEKKEYDNEWNVKVYYLYRHTTDMNYEKKIDSSMSRVNSLFRRFDGSSFTWDIEKVEIDSRYPNDIVDMTYDDGEKIIQELYNETDFPTEYEEYDVTIFVLGHSKGGAYTINYKSPIWISWSIFDMDDRNMGSIIISHEFFHTFGCEDIYPNCDDGNDDACGCIMGDISIDEITLCNKCSLHYSLENYGKTDIGEWIQ